MHKVRMSVLFQVVTCVVPVLTARAQSGRPSQGIPQRFSVFTFRDVRGQVPDGWERGWAPDGDLRMRPEGLRTFWFDIAVDKIPNTQGDRPNAPTSAVQFLRTFSTVIGPTAKYETISTTKAVAVVDSHDNDRGTAIINRTWYLVLMAEKPTAYIVIATASQALSSAGEKFDPAVIARAEAIVRGLSLKTPEPR